KESLLEAYGEQARPLIWDFVLMFQGALREYMSLIAQDHKNIDPTQVARFIVARFHTLIEHSCDAQPLVTSEDMKDYESIHTDLEPKTMAEQFQDLMRLL